MRLKANVLKQLFCCMLVVAMTIVGLPMTAYAANTASFDVTIRVYDGATNRLIDNVATTSVAYDPASEIIQSDGWTIPELSEFTDNEYGRVEQVTGNWYFPHTQGSVGTTVNWSINTGSKAITYHVTAWQPGTGSGSATGGTGSSAIQVGETGSKTWNTTIVYHSNYPDGTDVTYSQAYSMKSYVTQTNGEIYTYNQSPLNWTAPDGYEAATGTLPDGTKVYPWNEAADGSGEPHNRTYYFAQGESTVHLYAQWVPVGSEIVEEVKLTAKDGSETYSEKTYFVGDTAVMPNNTNKQDNMTFDGWDTSEAATTVVYNAGDGITINEDTTVWSVWSTRAVEDTVVLTYDANGGEGAPEASDSGIAEGFDASFTVSSVVPTMGDKVFKGWSTTPDGEVEYEAGDELTVTTDTKLYAVWGDAESGEGEGDDNTDDSTKVSEPGMDKKAEGSDSIGTVEPGDVISFTLNSHVGEDIADSVVLGAGDVYSGTYSLVFKDTLSGPVTLDDTSFVVTVDGKTLSASQYVLNTAPADGSTFTVTIDIVSLLNSGDFDYSRSGLAEVVVAYDATVNDDAEDEAVVRNDASVNDSVVDTVTGDVTNPEPIVPPETGSKAAMISGVAGVLLFGAAGVMYIVSKKKKEAE